MKLLVLFAICATVALAKPADPISNGPAVNDAEPSSDGLAINDYPNDAAARCPPAQIIYIVQVVDVTGNSGSIGSPIIGFPEGGRANFEELDNNSIIEELDKIVPSVDLPSNQYTINKKVFLVRQ